MYRFCSVFPGAGLCDDKGMAAASINIASLFRGRGLARIVIKKLSPNDNSKNQIYVGPGSEVLRVLPPREMVSSVPAGSGSRNARQAGSAFYGLLDFAWLDEAGAHPAPHAKLVYYPQYPEVRLSGFLRGCHRPPENLRTREDGRVLFMAVKPTGEILGVIGTSEDLASLPGHRVGCRGSLELHDLEQGGAPQCDPNPDELRMENIEVAIRLARSAGWTHGLKLSKGVRTPYGGRNAQGYTLEAILGVAPNGRPEPDFEEWEIKAHRSSAVTLFAPGPDGGLWVDEGRIAFMHRYGYPDRNGVPDRINFGGILRHGEVGELTGCTLGLNDDAIELRGPVGEIAASWSFAKLLPHWNRKHDNVAYFTYEERDGSSRTREYRFGERVELGITTEFQLLLRAIRDGKVYLDPAPKMTQGKDGCLVVKSRWQFRIKPKDLPSLYEDWRTLNLE